MIRQRLFFLLIFFLGMLGAAQSQMDQLRLGITLTPVPLLDFYQGGNLRLGLQYQLYPRTFLQAEWGQYLQPLHYNTRNLKGYNWRVSWQYNYSSWYYWSASYFYKDHSFDLSEEVLTNGQFEKKTYRLSKYANALTFRWGRMRWSKNKRTYLDFYMGAGLRWRKVRQTGLTPTDLEFLVSDSIVYTAIRKEGLIFGPDLSMGIRLGWAVWRKKSLER